MIEDIDLRMTGFVELTTSFGVIYVKPQYVASIGTRQSALYGISEKPYRMIAMVGGSVYAIEDTEENLQKLLKPMAGVTYQEFTAHYDA